MALFKAVVWALIFLTKLRFPPGVSIAIVLKESNLLQKELNAILHHWNTHYIPDMIHCQQDLMNCIHRRTGQGGQLPPPQFSQKY